MSYIGENSSFSFRDGCCEGIGDTGVAGTAALGKVLASEHRRFCAGCDRFDGLHILYALSGAMAESGRDVYICENTDMQSFRFGIPLLSVDCGVYITFSGGLKIHLFGSHGEAFSDKALSRVLSGRECLSPAKKGRIYQYTSFRSIYLSNIEDSLHIAPPLKAGVSCGNPSMRSLWREIFTGEDDHLVFQVSDDGSRVSAYSSVFGFISREQLILAAGLSRISGGENIFLPENFHIGADMEGVIRYSEEAVPENALKQRFLFDNLWLCAALVSRNAFCTGSSLIRDMYAVKREVAVEGGNEFSGKSFRTGSGRVLVSRSGKNRLTVTAQSYSTEAASELCCIWSEKLSRKQ